MKMASKADDVLFDLLHMELTNSFIGIEASERIEKEVSVSKLEHIGFCAGYRLVERLTKDWSRFKDELDTVKFLCKEFWSAIFKKQVDNLRTNHQGVYVLQDNSFRFLTQLSSGNQYLESSPKHVAFTCGLIRGALCNLGISCIVTAQIEELPICSFQIQAQQHAT